MSRLLGLLGTVMIAAPFVAILVLSARDIGWRQALVGFALVVALAAWVWMGAWALDASGWLR